MTSLNLKAIQASERSAKISAFYPSLCLKDFIQKTMAVKDTDIFNVMNQENRFQFILMEESRDKSKVKDFRFCLLNEETAKEHLKLFSERLRAYLKKNIELLNYLGNQKTALWNFYTIINKIVMVLSAEEQHLFLQN